MKLGRWNHFGAHGYPWRCGSPPARLALVVSALQQTAIGRLPRTDRNSRPRSEDARPSVTAITSLSSWRMLRSLAHVHKYDELSVGRSIKRGEGSRRNALLSPGSPLPKMARLLWTVALLGFLQSALSKPLNFDKRWQESKVKHEWTDVPKGWVEIGRPPADYSLRMNIGLKQDRFDELLEHLYEVSDPDHHRYAPAPVDSV